MQAAIRNLNPRRTRNASYLVQPATGLVEISMFMFTRNSRPVAEQDCCYIKLSNQNFAVTLLAKEASLYPHFFTFVGQRVRTPCKTFDEMPVCLKAQLCSSTIACTDGLALWPIGQSGCLHHPLHTGYFHKNLSP